MLTVMLSKNTLDGLQSWPTTSDLWENVKSYQYKNGSYIPAYTHMNTSLHSGRAASTLPYAPPSVSAGEQVPR